jgi:hypothetical protein
MRKALVVATTVTVLALLLAVSAGCGGSTTATTGWVTVFEKYQPFTPSSGIFRESTSAFELTGIACRLRYETMNSFTVRVYLVPKNDPAKRVCILDRSVAPKDGETTLDVERGTYYLDIEGVSDNQRYQLWLEEAKP